MTVALSPWSEQFFVVVVVGIVSAAKQAPESMGCPARFHVAEKIGNINAVKDYVNLHTKAFTTILVVTMPMAKGRCFFIVLVVHYQHDIITLV